MKKSKNLNKNRNKNNNKNNKIKTIGFIIDIEFR